MAADVSPNPIEQDTAGLVDIGVVPSMQEYLKRLWQRRDFILAVPIGQLRAQTQNTFVGAGWHLLNPIFSAALYYVIFGVLFGGSNRIENYPSFLVVGVFAFVFTTRTVTAGARAVTGNMGLITQINFPRIALPLSATVAETLSHSLALGALFLMMPPLGERPSLEWLAVAPVVLLQSVFNLGLATVVARLVFQFRDIEKLLPHVIRFWMYLSGVFFTVEFVIEAVDGRSVLVWLFQLNPPYVYMSLMREALLTGFDAETWMWVAAIAWALISCLFGVLFFRAKEVEYGRG